MDKIGESGVKKVANSGKVRSHWLKREVGSSEFKLTKSWQDWVAVG